MLRHEPRASQQVVNTTVGLSTTPKYSAVVPPQLQSEQLFTPLRDGGVQSLTLHYCLVMKYLYVSYCENSYNLIGEKGQKTYLESHVYGNHRSRNIRNVWLQDEIKDKDKI